MNRKPAGRFFSWRINHNNLFNQVRFSLFLIRLHLQAILEGPAFHFRKMVDGMPIALGARQKDCMMMPITEITTGSSPEYSPATQCASARTKPRVRVWLTDDNAGFRHSLAELLGRSSDFDCERQFNSAESLLSGLADGPAPDVILLDVEMGGITGVDALRPIRKLAPEVRVVIVTSFFDPIYERLAMRDGASAFLLKAYAPQDLVGEIYRALATPIRLPDIAEGQSTPAAIPALSPELTAGKSVFARFILWLAHSYTTLMGQFAIHRPAATSK